MIVSGFARSEKLLAQCEGSAHRATKSGFGITLAMKGGSLLPASRGA